MLTSARTSLLVLRVDDLLLDEKAQEHLNEPAVMDSNSCGAERKENFMLFSDHTGSLLGRQPGALLCVGHRRAYTLTLYCRCG